ncbi:dienelactone hydrolase family protein [Fulvivirgaceae bacterium BMA10]|uniref:Dienelactone hydrolase family protein n=1 Tax=Splendidivirga corallicola TaxID=3051826 RepID=A0ABT8KL41_9BACT|nr:dienelactone hydrolase family protein [Fulvivirgaceae bacterium BMA10]
MLIENGVIDSIHNNKKILFDLRYLPNHIRKPIIIFIHGFKGFKDWGHWNLIANYFAEHGFVFIKMNLSHNGTTLENPLGFDDLDAFGKNNHTIEMDDIGSLIDHVFSNGLEIAEEALNRNKVYLIGHSRGGGCAILKAVEDKRVSGLVTWASVDTLQPSLAPDEIELWKKEGVRFIYNGRTKQQMPLYFQLWEDIKKNQERFNIQNKITLLNKPMLILHGDKDETLPLSMAENLKQWKYDAQFKVIKNGNHTFGGQHPYPYQKLQPITLELVEETISFLNKKKRGSE